MGCLIFFLLLLIPIMKCSIVESDPDLANFYTDTKTNGNDLKEFCDKSVFESRARTSQGLLLFVTVKLEIFVRK